MTRPEAARRAYAAAYAAAVAVGLGHLPDHVQEHTTMSHTGNWVLDALRRGPSSNTTCPACGGIGRIRYPPGPHWYAEQEDDCAECAGTGWTPDEEPVSDRSP